MKYRIQVSAALAVLTMGSAVLAAPEADAGRLATVQKRGVLHCGVNQRLPGFGFLTKKGKFTGFDVEVCHAVAAAVFKDAKKVKYVPLNAAQRFTALQSGEIDLLSRNTTWTTSRDGSVGIDFTVTTFYDGQGVMVKTASGVKKMDDLSGATVCTNAGTTTEKNITDYFARKGLKFKLITYEGADGVMAGLRAGRCDATTTDKTSLLALKFAEKNPADYHVLAETISKEPLGPAVPSNDSQWRDVVVWTIYGLIAAEELDISSANVDAKRKSKDPEVARLLGAAEKLGEGLGLGNDFLYHVIKQVGNYGEVFDRHLGTKSQFKIARGLNALWKDGGLQYAPPFR